MQSTSHKISFWKQDVAAVFALSCYLLLLLFLTDAGTRLGAMAETFVHPDDIPLLDTSTTCNVSAVAGAAKMTNAFCIATEQKAEALVKQQWIRYSTSDRMTCITWLSDFKPSYTELLTCLDLKDR